MRQVIATMIKADNLAVEGLALDSVPVWSREYTNKPDNPTLISALFIGGPYDGRVSPDSPARRRLFVCDLQAVTERAGQWGRDRLRDEDLVGARAACVSPFPDQRRHSNARPLLPVGARAAGFRCRHSRGNRADSRQPRFPLPDFARSGRRRPRHCLHPAGRRARVSVIFLWSSIPDDELLDAAVRGRLHEPAVLDRQVRRMLGDKRARMALVQNFFASWLQTRNVWLLTPDLNQKFPWFDDNLRVAFVREMELFLDAQLKEDRSIGDLLTSSQTFLNEQLARHYGVSGVLEAISARHAHR
jgi:hypothetical protein